MWKSTVVRLFGALFAVALTATACGSGSETNTAQATIETAEQAEEELPVVNDVDDANDTTEGSVADHGADAADEDHSAGNDGHAHDHDSGIEVDASLPIPAVDIALTETDNAGVFAISVSLDNFTITEDALDGEPVDNEGHMHLYLDGERVERFFALDHEITVPDGEHVVEVELSANDHRAYTLDGSPIRAQATVTGSGEESSGVSATEATATLTASFTGGAVTVDGDDRIEIEQGEVVMVTVTSDTAEEVHVHGYDIFANVSADDDAMIVFTADIPGRFEIEFEASGLFIAELVVS